MNEYNNIYSRKHLKKTTFLSKIYKMQEKQLAKKTNNEILVVYKINNLKRIGKLTKKKLRKN